LAPNKLGARRLVRLFAVIAVALGAGACTALDDMLASIPVFSTLRQAPSFAPYTAPRNPPANAVAFSTPFGTEGEAPITATDAGLRAFGDTAHNPFPMSEKVLAAGQAAYQTHCFVCHGADGRGKGPVTGTNPVTGAIRFPMQQSLVDPLTVGRTDGYIYGMIRVARGGLMPPYGARIAHDERWFIVNYVRYLQQQAQGGGATQAAPAGAAQGRE
jgi:mono/diheme cytochrome c family protein